MFTNTLIIEMLEMILEDMKEFPKEPNNAKLDSIISDLEELIVQLKSLRLP